MLLLHTNKFRVCLALPILVNNCRTNSLNGEIFFFLQFRATGVDGNEKLLKIVPDWTEEAANDDHLWSVTSHNVDFCYIGESECTVSRHILIFYEFKHYPIFYKKKETDL